MTTVTCPHNEPALRVCAACTSVDPTSGERACNFGEATGHATQDSEGDVGVIGGNHTFWVVEDFETTCGCQLSELEEDQAKEKMVEGLIDDDLDRGYDG